MNEDNVLAEIGKEFARQSYKDIGEHIIKPTAKVVGTIPDVINRLLVPVHQWIEEGKYNLEKTKKILAIKLENIKQENLVSPDSYIAVPALQYISYCMDNEELRDMYANLLASSMNKVVKNGVHPSFVEIIKQLSPDEAKILREIQKGPLYPLIHLQYVRPDNKGEREELSNFSDIGYKIGCEYPEWIAQYLNNMERLGLIQISKGSFLINKELYEPLKTHPFIVPYLNQGRIILKGYSTYKFTERYYGISDFGKSFCKICIGDIPSKIRN